MKFVMLAALVLYGLYYYVSRRFEFHDTLAYAQKHSGAVWSAPTEYYVGLVYYQRSEYPKAQEAFSQLLKDHPTDYHAPRALILLSDSAEYNRDWDAARAALSQYIENYPDGRDVRLAKQRLELVNYKHGPGAP